MPIFSGVTISGGFSYEAPPPPPPPVESDPYFNLTTLLLPGNGANNSTNNTFLDSSTNNFTITRIGNTSQGTFSPFSQTGWSGYFSSGNRLTVADNVALRMETGDFTIEFWWYPEKNDTWQTLYDKGFVSSGALLFQTNSSSRQISIWASGVNVFTANTAAAQGVWNHVALVRNGSTLTLYLNGVSVGSATNSTNFNNTSTLGIGANQSNGSDPTDGYISNLRVVKGTAVYTSNFTTPTSPLTAISGTSLLTCQNNRFIDNSSNNFTVARNGNVSAQAFSPFEPTAAWSASTNGGSGYFDGNGDYLSIADSAAIRFGTSNFTIQGWIYRNAAGVIHSIAAKGGASTGWVFQIHSDNKLRFTHTTTNIDSSGTILSGVWTHVAVVREGTGTNQVKLYINGVLDGQGTVSTDFTQTEQLNIGADRSNSSVMNGFIAGFKYVVGTAETITVPTAPPIDGTVLLNFTNATIYDSTSKNDLETVGDAKVSTVESKFGGSSMSFDGTGDWITAPNSQNLHLRTNNFTIEMWVYLATGDIGSNRGLAGKGNASAGWLASLNTTEKVVFTYGTSTITSSGSISTNQWVHVAVVRQGTGSNQTKIYINGTNDGTGTVNTDFNQTEILYIGANRTGGNPMKGYIQDLRITKGYARYTSNFTPPETAFPTL